MATNTIPINHTFIIAEVGINHNGDLDTTKKLIDVAAISGCDAVKFQKRTIELVYTEEQLNTLRESPWGTTTREQKEGLEFGKEPEILGEVTNHLSDLFTVAADIFSIHKHLA